MITGRFTSLMLACVLTLVSCGGGDDGPGSEAASTDTTAGDPLAGTLAVTSPGFAEFGTIPARHTCEGDDVSPALAWIGVPADAITLEIEVTDPDAADGQFVHWHVTGIPTMVSGIGEGSAPPGTQLPNSAGSQSWTGPCPPPGDEPHRYVFTVRAVDGAGAVLAEGTTTGLFGRS